MEVSPPALAPGAVVVDMSSSNPEGTTALGKELAALGLSLVDAPVSGGVQRAGTGTLTIMIGADDEDAIGVAQPVLDALGESFFQTGPLGSGSCDEGAQQLRRGRHVRARRRGTGDRPAFRARRRAR